MYICEVPVEVQGQIRFVEKYFCLGYCEQEIVISVH